jgi:small-conductance mechanosensitive channel
MAVAKNIPSRKQPSRLSRLLTRYRSIQQASAPPVLAGDFRVLQFTFNMHRIRSAGLQFLLPALVFIILPLASLFPQTASETSSDTGDEIIRFLNQTLVWDRQLTALQQVVTEPSDVLFLNDNRRTADQAVRLGFDFARARSQALGAGSAAANPAASSSSQYQRLADLAGKVDQQAKQTQQELDKMRQQLGNASGKKRRLLQATIAETQSELELFQARRDALRNMLQITNVSANGKSAAGTLAVQIEELARTLPAATDTAKEPGSGAGSSSSGSTAPLVLQQQHRAVAPGTLALISDLFALRDKIGALDSNLHQTDSLGESVKALRAPLVAKMRELTQQGDQLAAQPDSTDPAVLAQQKKDLDGLTAEYKQLSASLLPLGKLSILLDLYKHSTVNWRSAVDNQYKTELKGLLLRLLGLGLLLGVVLGVSEVWRRATFRYVTDSRRRNQFLLMRRIVLWSLVAIIIAIAFASELGAITTFAGLLTAGVVVALQNVILAVAGYFFLIGKYGVRVGDRVQVAGITGDVVDIGVVRLHLMEVTGGSSPRPTGRIVVFSNSVVFQAGSGLFKPIPGTSFLWHEMTLTLSADSNYRQVEQRLLEAVNKVYGEYRDRMEMQRHNMERSLRSVPIRSFAPESRLRLTPTGLEVIIRYPVELGNAAEIDDRITRELLEAIGREPKLRLLGAQIEAKSA